MRTGWRGERPPGDRARRARAAGLFAGLACACGLPGVAAAEETVQRSCRFALVILSDGTTRGADLGATVARRGAAGRVVTSGGGDYAGTVERTGQAYTFTFRTRVSTEEVTVGDDGRALWTIEFDPGREVLTDGVSVLGYAGDCAAGRRTG